MKSNLFLNEYFKKRKSLIYRSVLFFVFFVLVFATIYLNENSEEFLGKITIEGIIHDRKDILEKLSELEEKKNLKGLILTVNSPGGTFVSSKELYDAINLVRKQVPTAVYMKEMATSGAYLLSLSSDRIFCNQGTITGSIGVLLQSADITELLSKLGVNPLIVKSGELKAIPNPLEKTNQYSINYLSDVISLMQEEFMRIVLKNRKISDDAIQIIEDGRIFTAKQAKEINLIDEIGNENDAINWIKKKAKLDETIKVIDFTDDENILGLFNLNFFRKKIKTMNFNFINGILAIWIPGL